MTAGTALGYDDLQGLIVRLTGDEKHDWSSLSTLDVLWTLYDRVLEPGDRFMLSKGHGPTAYYAVLAAKGLLPADELDGFGGFDSPLGHHPDRKLVPGVEISSGSLGHGLPIAVGAALAVAGSAGSRAAGARSKDRPPKAAGGRRVYVLVGDGELDEGSNWEAVQWAGRIGLASLSTVVVDNHSSTYHWPGGIERRFELEGWTSAHADGRDHDALERAFRARTGDAPHVVVAEVQRR